MPFMYGKYLCSATLSSDVNVKLSRYSNCKIVVIERCEMVAILKTSRICQCNTYSIFLDTLTNRNLRPLWTISVDYFGQALQACRNNTTNSGPSLLQLLAEVTDCSSIIVG